MTQGIFRARISCAFDHMHPAWSTANEIRPWYTPWSMSHNHGSIIVDFDLFVDNAQLQYIMTQGTSRARISCASDHMLPAWSTANKIRPWYVPWIMSYNLCSINVWPRAFRCRKFILYLLLPLLLLPAATGSCHYLFLLLPAVPID